MLSTSFIERIEIFYASLGGCQIEITTCGINFTVYVELSGIDFRKKGTQSN